MSWDDENDLDIVHMSSDNDSRAAIKTVRPRTNTNVNDRSNNKPPPDDDNSDADVLGVDEEVVVKKRRTMAKLDDDRLINPNMGIPYLQRKVSSGLLPRLKKRKGEELRDLSTILQFYQLWAHKLYPKANFGDFLQIARTAGKTPRMRMFRQGWISDEKSKKLGIDAVQGDSNTGAEKDKTTADNAVPGTVAAKNSDGVGEMVTSNNGDLFVGNVNEDDFDGIDFDEDFNDDVFKDSNNGSTSNPAGILTANSSNGSTVTDTIRDNTSGDTIPNSSQSRRPRNAFIFDDEDDELDVIPSNTYSSSIPKPNRGVPDDDDMDELMADSASKPKTTPPANSRSGIPDEDEMDELLREDFENKLSRPFTDGIPDEDDMDELLKTKHFLEPAMASTSHGSSKDENDDLLRPKLASNSTAKTLTSNLSEGNDLDKLLGARPSSKSAATTVSASAVPSPAFSKPALKRAPVPISTGSPNEDELEELLGARSTILSSNFSSPSPEPAAAVVEKNDDDMAELLHAESLLTASKASESTHAPVPATATSSIHGIPDEDELAGLLGNPVSPTSKQQQGTFSGIPDDIEDFEQDAFESMQDLGF